MNPPDFEQARQYALERLASQLSPKLTYHSLWHTRDEVAPIADKMARLEGVTGEERRLLLTAAYFHDIGFVEQRYQHELAGIQIAWQVLPRLGFSPQQIKCIEGLIRATIIPQRPQTLLEAILADADLDVLGREDFWKRNHDLRSETEAYDGYISDDEWRQRQYKFLRSHRYFTATAQRSRGRRKHQILEKLRSMVEAPVHLSVS